MHDISPLLRLLKDALQESQFSMRYQYLLAALLCCTGRGLREELDRQGWLVSILAKVAQNVRDTSPSTRQVRLLCELVFTVILERSILSTEHILAVLKGWMKNVCTRHLKVIYSVPSYSLQLKIEYS